MYKIIIWYEKFAPFLLDKAWSENHCFEMNSTEKQLNCLRNNNLETARQEPTNNILEMIFPNSLFPNPSTSPFVHASWPLSSHLVLTKRQMVKDLWLRDFRVTFTTL